MLKIEACNVFELEKYTGICPRDSWENKKANKTVYYVKEESGRTMAFLYKADAIKFAKGGV